MVSPIWHKLDGAEFKEALQSITVREKICLTLASIIEPALFCAIETGLTFKSTAALLSTFRNNVDYARYIDSVLPEQSDEDLMLLTSFLIQAMNIDS